MPQGVALWAGYSVKCLVPCPCVSILPSLVTSCFNTKLFWYKFIELTCKLFHILGLWNEEYWAKSFSCQWRIQTLGGGASSPWDKRGASLKQKNFSALQASAGAKKRGGQATLLDLPLLVHIETILEVIKIFVQFHCLSSYHRIKMPCIETTGYLFSFLQSCLGEDAVEPWYNGVSKEGENIFATMRFCYIKVLFHKFYYYWGKENCSLYRGLP